MPPALSTPKSVQFFTYDILNVAFKASFAWVVNIQFTFFSRFHWKSDSAADWELPDMNLRAFSCGQQSLLWAGCSGSGSSWLRKMAVEPELWVLILDLPSPQ